MGTDILGWIECKERWAKHWFGVISLEGIPARYYDMFGCLFGVRNNACFRPIAPDRGLPIDSSNAVRKAMVPRYNIEWNIIEDVADDPGIGGYTWITWREIKNIDWEEEAEEIDKRVHLYEKNEQSQFVMRGKASYYGDISQDGWASLKATGTWENEDKLYRYEKIKRKDVLGEGDWSLLFDLMERMGQFYGDANVRMVVWFGS